MKIAKVILVLGLVFAAGFLAGRFSTGQEAPTAAGARFESSPTDLLSAVPDVRQSTSYSCGAAALQAVLAYWGTSEREDRLMSRLRTSPEQGTSPDNILRVAREFGLEAELREGMTIAELESALEAGRTVIVDIQAWRGRPDKSWEETWDDGHYVVLVGRDASNFYFEDPSLLGSRGFIPKAELPGRWHDYEGDPPLDEKDRVYRNAAIIIHGRQAAPHLPAVRIE